jgi:hypothetical protein
MHIADQNHGFCTTKFLLSYRRFLNSLKHNTLQKGAIFAIFRTKPQVSAEQRRF